MAHDVLNENQNYLWSFPSSGVCSCHHLQNDGSMTTRKGGEILLFCLQENPPHLWKVIRYIVEGDSNA
jgi:hypothetical protein